MGLGGQKGQRSPTEAPNTLRSIAYAKILFLLCRGRIRGWVGGELGQALRIDGVPLKSPDGTFNFKGWTAYFREGLPNQAFIPGLETNSQIISVGALVRNGINVTRTINDPDTDAVDVTIRIPALFSVEDDGDVVGTHVQYQVQVQASGQSYSTVISQRIADKTNSPYQRSHHVVLEGAAPWNIRVVRITADSADESRLRNAIEWEYYSLIEYDKRGYSGFATTGIHIDTKQIDSLGTLSAEIDGKLVLVPHNYDPDNHSYDGIFDGSMVVAWTNNPVWVALDILLTRVDLSDIRLFEFYDAAQYCDELIDGEPRFTFNHVFTKRKSTFATARDVVNTFNGKFIPRGTKIGITVDKPKEPGRTFSTDEMSVAPEYDVESSLDVATVCTVTYLEPEQDYNPVSFVVRDEPGITRFGEREINLDALGCTSRNQAARTALWTLATPRLNPVRVRFQLPLSGKLVVPGDVFTIFDPRRDRSKVSGRVFAAERDATEDRITLDQLFEFNDNLLYELFLIGDNGILTGFSVTGNAIVDGRTQLSIVAPDRVTDDLWPTPGDIWVIKADGVQTGYTWRCVETTPVSGKHSHFDIDAVLYDPDKYTYIDSLGKEAAGNYTARTASPVLRLPGTPSEVRSITYYKSFGNELIPQIVVSWSYPIDAQPQLDYFEVQYQKDGDPSWQKADTVEGRNYTLENAGNSTYVFRVSAVNRLGRRSEWVVTNPDDVATGADGGTPPTVSNLTLAKSDFNTVHLKWDTIDDVDVRNGGFFRIRHTPLIIDARWDSGTLVERVPGNDNAVTLPYQEGTYMVRTYTREGIPSNVPAYVTTALSVLTNRTLLYTFQESPTFPGVRDSTRVISDKLRLGYQEVWDTIPSPFDDLPAPFDDWGAGNAGNTFVASGFYQFSTEYQISATPAQFYLYPVVDVAVIHSDQAWDNLEGQFDDIPISELNGAGAADRDTDYGESPFAKIEVSISIDNGLTYSDYIDLKPGEFYGTHVRPRLRMESDRPALSNEVSDLRLLVFSPSI